MKKKIFLSLVLIFTVSFSVFAVPSFGESQRIFDVPLVTGIQQFGGILRNLEKTVITLISFFCFLNIAFNAFKLWAGTVQVKKVYVDIIYKCVICFMILQFYIPATDYVINMSTKIGANCSGGYQTITKVYGEAYKTLKESVKAGLPALQKAIINSTKNDKYVSGTMVDSLVQSGMTEEEAKKLFSSNGKTIVYEQTNENGKKYFTDEKGNEIQVKSLTDKIKKAEKKLNGDKSVKQQLQNLGKIAALQEIIMEEPMKDMTEEELKNINTLKSDSEKTIDNLFYNPYLMDENNKPTGLLSVSAMMKTIFTLSDVIALASAKNVDPDTGKIEDVKFVTGGNVLLRGVCALVRALLYWIGMVACVIYIMCEYMVTILEYYLVTSLAILLIPFLFLDSTKSYAQNILKIFLNYFFKILITTIVVFFVLGFFIQTETMMFTSANLDATSSLGMYLMVLLLGLFMCSSCRKLPSAILSGQPQMGIGEVAGTAKSAGGALQKAGRAVGSAAVGAALGAATTGAGMVSAAKAAQSTASAGGVSKGGQAAASVSAALKAGGASMVSSMLNKADKFAGNNGNQKSFQERLNNQKEIGKNIGINTGKNAEEKAADKAKDEPTKRPLTQSEQSGQHKSKPQG